MPVRIVLWRENYSWAILDFYHCSFDRARPHHVPPFICNEFKPQHGLDALTTLVKQRCRQLADLEENAAEAETAADIAAEANGFERRKPASVAPAGSNVTNGF